MANTEDFEMWLGYCMARLPEMEQHATAMFGSICELTAGWASPGKLAVLEHAISLCMNEGEEYLEIGSYTGRSLAGALYFNTKRAQVIDPFGIFLPDGDFIQGEWEKTMAASRTRDRVTLHKTLSQDFQADLPPIGVFYYDGDHDSGHTYEGLKKFERYLSPKAIVIVDDYMIYGGHGQRPYSGHRMVLQNPVQVDTDRWLAETKDRTRLISVLPWEQQSAVILYERN